MKSIEVKTTQNVVLEYELADLKDRALAFLVDQACLWVSILLVASFGYSSFSFGTTSELAFQILLSIVFIFYGFAMEVFNNGQSLGKMVLRIQVIKTSGGQATMPDYAARWAFRMIDIWFSLGGIASILVASSAKAQRIGDIVANTAVIKLTPQMNLKLSDLLAIKSQESYKTTYQQARQLEERDVLLIKTTLERHREYRNEAHSEAVKILSEKIQEILRIEDRPHDHSKFLQTVLNDYVVLTR